METTIESPGNDYKQPSFTQEKLTLPQLGNDNLHVGHLVLQLGDVGRPVPGQAGQPLCTTPQAHVINWRNEKRHKITDSL